MRKLIIFLLVSVMIFSCTEPTSVDENLNVEVFEENNYFPLEVGNEWVFNTQFTNEYGQISPVYTEKMVVERKLEVEGIDAFEISHYFDNKKYLTTYATTTKDQIWLYGKTMEPFLYSLDVLPQFVNSFGSEDATSRDYESCCFLDENWVKVFDANEVIWSDESVTKDTMYTVYTEESAVGYREIGRDYYKNVNFTTGNKFYDAEGSVGNNSFEDSKWISFDGNITAVVINYTDDSEVTFSNGSDTFIFQTFNSNIQFANNLGLVYSKSSQTINNFNDIEDQTIINCERILVSSSI